MIDWDAFHFLRPTALIGLLLLPLISYLLYKFKQNETQWRSYIPNHLQSFLLIESKKYKSRFQYWILAFAWIIATLAIAGPTWEKLPQPVYQSQSGKVILTDMSLSMRSTDVTPDRLTRLRFKALDLVDLIDDGEVGLVAYAGDAFTISPLTEDVENIKNLIPSLSPEIMPVLGSNPYAAMVEAKQLLENAGYAEGDIYWLTDGISREDIELIREFIDQNTVRISVLLVGTEQGAPITQIDGTLLKDRSGNIVIPKVEPNLFKTALANSNSSIVRMRADDSDLKAMVLEDNIFSREIENNEEQRSGDLWRDMGAYVVLLLLPLVALLFRRGIAICIAVGLFYLPTEHAQAQEMETISSEQKSTVDALFLNQNQQAIKHFENQSYEQAQDQFVDLDWKAAAAYKAGDFQLASELYGQLEGIDNQYNFGNSLAMLGQLQAAIESYDAVLEYEPEHEQAKKNKKILEDMLEQQQNENQSQDQQSQNQDQQQNQNQSDDNQQSEEQQQSQDQNEQQSESQEQQQSQNQQSDSQQEPSEPEQQQQNESAQQEAERQSENEDSSQDESEAQEQQQDSVVQGNIDPSQMTPEEREKMRQMQMLLNRIPDDPSFLLKRKMLVESQQRRQQGAPLMQQQTW